MSTTSSIEWTDRTWNPVRGCSLVSEGCRNCYAMKQAHRFSGAGKAYEGLTDLGPQGPRWTGKIRLVPDLLEEPLHWKKPCRVFVNSMSDLFHDAVPREFIKAVVGVTVDCPEHTFQILTKRPQRMLEFCRDCQFPPNVWLGVSVEDEKTLWRIDELRKVPAAIRFVSFEPLLDDLGQIDLSGIHWAIIGGESGPKARPCDVANIRSIVRQCKRAGVPVFVKQIGSKPVGWCAAIPHGQDPESEYEADHCDLYEASEIAAPCRGGCWLLQDKKGGDIREFPEDLRIREYPHV